MLAGKVRVYLCSGNAGVTQQFLNVSEGSTTLQHVSGKTMPQHVRSYHFVNVCPLGAGFQYGPYPLSGQAVAAAVQE
jgi:hypothetical protein